LWKHNQATPYVPSPLLAGNRLYFTQKNTATLSCLDAHNGQLIYRKGLAGLDTLYASPVNAAGRIYIVDRDGTTVVLTQGDEPKVLAVNALKTGIDGSPAVAGNQLFLRGQSHLYCLEEQP
jgi:outer membrane protein assembly factor BamB